MPQPKIRLASLVFGWLVFAIAASFYSYEYLLRILPSTMVNELMQTHQIDTLSLGVLSSAYYITYSLMQLPVGVAIDYYGPKRLLVMATLACLVGSFLFSSVDSYTFAFVGRILVGFGSAFAFVGVLRIATLWLPINQFAIATGLITTLGMLGGILGDVTLSYLVTHYGWHSTVIISALIGIPILIALLCIPNKQLAIHKQTEKYTLAKAVYGLWEVIKMPSLWLNALAGCLLYIPLSAFAELWGIPYLQTVYGLDKVVAGETISWLFLGWAIGAPIIGLIADRTQKYFLILFVGSGLALIAIFIFLNSHFVSAATLNMALLVFGIVCTGQVLIMVIVRHLVPMRIMATAMAFTNMIIMMGGLVFQTLIGDLVRDSSQDMLTNQITQADQALYIHAMYVIPVAIVFALIVLWVNYKLVARHGMK